MSFPTRFDIEDIYLSEKQKSNFDYLSTTMDYHIAQLVRDKKRIKTARNLYEGVRDSREFRYLEETFGIETPMSVTMTPLIKTRVDVLLGILLNEDFDYQVTVNDKGSFDKIEQEKKDTRAKRVVEAYQDQISANVTRASKGEEPKQDIVTKNYLKRLDRFVNEEFVSSIEIAAQSLIKFYSQDGTVKLRQKLKQFFLDLLVTGEAYYRTYIPKLGADPVLEICKPENIFYTKNTNHQFISDGNNPNVTAIVRRYYMKREEILNRWGHVMNESAKVSLFGERPTGTHYNSIYSGRDLENLSERDRYFYQDSHTQYTHNTLDVYPVYHVEWLANNEVELSDEDKEDLRKVEDIKVGETGSNYYGHKAGSGKSKDKAYRYDRYEGIRIGDDVYLEIGKSKYQPRSEANPYKTVLSYNGVSYNDRNGKPYSLALSLKGIQDSYDIVKFFRNNLIANSGVNGSRINLAAIPKVLGTTFMERLLKFMALRKQGIELIDPTEDGATLFQHYGDFSNSIDGNVIQSLKIVLEGLEQEADTVTGINRHMYQAAEQRDAVNNVKVGINQTSLITKDLFSLVGEMNSQMFVDMINRAKLSYRKGKRGSYIVGKRHIVFNIIPENFCFTDYAISVVDSSKESEKLAKLEVIIPELVAKGSLDDGFLIKMAMMESTTEIISMVEDNIAEREEENDITSQLSNENEQLKEQLKEMEKELKGLQNKVESYSEQDYQLKVKELEMKAKDLEARQGIEDRKLRLDTDIAKEEIKKDKQVVALEREQLYMETGGNAKEIKNNI